MMKQFFKMYHYPFPAVKKTCLLLMGFVLLNLSVMGQTINYKTSNTGFQQVIKDLELKLGKNFVYTSDVIKDAKPVSVNASNVSFEELLKKIFEGQPFAYSVVNGVVVIKSKKDAAGAGPEVVSGVDISGVVKDEEDRPLENVSIVVRDAAIGTQTQRDGSFSLSDITANAILEITAVGYETQYVAVRNKNFFTVTLKRGGVVLEDAVVEVVNTGYQKIPKERATGSFGLVSAEELDTKIQPNLLERLEGLTPGILIMNGRDDGTDDAVTIRGVSTLYGTKRPLIVVDNFPIEGDINTINPNDVLSITVLRDAAAASIWGARAANGVIVITTRSGRKGKLNFLYSNTFQFTAKPNLNQMRRLSSADDISLNKILLNPNRFSRLTGVYATSINDLEKIYVDSLQGNITPEEYMQRTNALSMLDNTGQVRDLLMQQPLLQTHSLSFNGGNDNNTYYGSIRYVGDKGLAIRSKTDNINAILRGNFKVNDRLSFNSTITFNVDNATSGIVDPLDFYMSAKPYAMLLDENGNQLPIRTRGDASNQSVTNSYIIDQRIKWGLEDESFYPLKDIYRRDVTSRTAYTRLQSELKYRLFKGINFNLSYQYENGNTFQRDYQHKDYYQLVKLINDYVSPTVDDNYEYVTNADGTLSNPLYNIPRGGTLQETNLQNISSTYRAVIDIDKAINNHTINAIVGSEIRQAKSIGSSFKRYGYNDQSLAFVPLDYLSLRDVNSTSELLSTFPSGFYASGDNNSYVENRFVSVFANAGYAFKNKYLLSGSFRIDQTNLFGTDPKYLYRPMWSVGASWVLSQEDFLKSSSFVDLLKIRTTYGVNGNIPKNSGPFPIGETGISYFPTLPYVTINIPANNELRWERTVTTNFGLDFQLFKGRLNGAFDYYIRRTSDLLSLIAINPTRGFSTATLNGGNLNNDGYEISLQSVNVRNKDFVWNTVLNYAYNKNKVVKTAISPDDNTAVTIARGYNLYDDAVYVPGYPYKSLFSFRYAGLTDVGDLQIYNADGMPTVNSISSPDATVFSGSTRPFGTASLGNEFQYRDFSLSFMFVYYGDYYMRRGISYISSGNTSSYSDVLAGVWRQPGDEAFATIPGVLSNTYSKTYYSNLLDINVFNASYLKLREVRLTYNLPKTLLSHSRTFKDVQLIMQMRNLWTLTKNKMGFDPESFSGGYPRPTVPATYAFGINVTL